MLVPDAAGLTQAAELLAAGQLVAFPTETVYGLGGDARNDRAVAAIFEAKGRPQFNPLIVHVADIDAARQIAVFDDEAERLASAFWPGALTLVLPVRSDAGLSPLLTAGLDTVAVRVPAHEVAQYLLAAFDGPIAAPSANPSGKISPTRAGHVIEGLAGKIAAVLDGGRCEVGLESTIVAPSPQPVLLRPGGIPAEALEDCLGRTLQTAGTAQRPSSPGQLASHYAPGASLRLNATAPGKEEVFLGFDHTAQDPALNLSPTGDLLEAAANLFHYLRQADEAAGPDGAIAVAPIPDHGLGRAINDRLRRAAAPRSSVT